MRSSSALPILLAAIYTVPASTFADDAPNTAPTVLRPRNEIAYVATSAAPMIGGRDVTRKLKRQAPTGDQTCGWFQVSQALPWTCEENHECATDAQKVVACVPSGTPSPAPAGFYSECRDYSQAQWKSCTSLPDGIGCCTATDLPACGLIVWKEDPGRSMWRCYDRPTTITLAETPPPGAVISTATLSFKTAPTTATATAASSAMAGTETAGLANAAPDNGSDDDDADDGPGLIGGNGSGEQSGGDHPNIGAIVGGAVGGSVALLLILVGTVFILARRRKQKKEEAAAEATTAPADPDSDEPKGPDGLAAAAAAAHASGGGGVGAPQGRPSVASFGPLENMPYPTVSLVPPSATTLVPGSPAKHGAAATYDTAGAGSHHSSSPGVSEFSLADHKQLHEMPYPIILDDSSSEEAAFDAERGAYVRQSMYSQCISPSNEILDLEGGTSGAANDLGGLAERVAIRY